MLVKLWIAGARPRTLPAAVVPVAVGGAVAAGSGEPAWWRLALALVVSLALQVGVNYANDYSDGIRGTDEVRVGPVRLVGSGLVSPKRVKAAALIAFGIAAVAGGVLAIVTTLWLVAVGIAAIAAAWFYTGGKNPYGYMGLGEVFVFVFFGVVATVGSTFVVVEELPSLTWLASIPVGCLACALLVINNLRDIPTDKEVGKRTLAVRLGDARTRSFYGALIALAGLFTVLAAVQRPAAVFGLFGVAAALPAWRVVRSGAVGRDLIAVLGLTGRAQLVFGATFAIGLVVGA
jgi:1,4-dihydroxy-2-naphthoate octaprenyltransferase